MFCKKCGAALPSYGYICKSCGTMMDSEQIKIQREFIKGQENERMGVILNSDKYSNEPVNRNYSKNKDNKFLGALLILLVILVLVILAILKVM